MKETIGKRTDEQKGDVHVTSTVTEEPQTPSSPSKPLVVIEPSRRSWAASDLRDLWVHRELLYFLIWRDLKVRYKQTLLGATWIIIQPVLTMVMFTLFFSVLVRVPSDGIPYPLFVYAGLFLWLFFSNAVSTSSSSVVVNSSLITKVYFPRIILPVASIGARVVDLAIMFLILIGLTAYYGVVPTFSVVMLPVLLMMITLLALGIGTLFSALNVQYRDVGVALATLLQFWMYASPVIYPISLVPANWQWLYALNPLVGIIENFRAALLGLEFNWQALAVSAVFILAILVYSAYTFRQAEKSFADII